MKRGETDFRGVAVAIEVVPLPGAGVDDPHGPVGDDLNDQVFATPERTDDATIPGLLVHAPEHCWVLSVSIQPGESEHG